MQASETGDNPGEPEQLWRVGAVAERLQLSIRTLHHWDETGLVSPSARTSGGFRLYSEGDVQRLTAVRRMKPLGFSLAEMKQLLAAFDTMNQASDQAALDDAMAVIRTFNVRAEEQYAHLQQRLSWAAEFKDVLEAIQELHPD